MVEKIGKKKGNKAVLEWVQSIKNHVYWWAASSEENIEEIKEKWLSFLNHIINIHEGHGDLYPQCQHGAIKRDWLKKGT